MVQTCMPLTYKQITQGNVRFDESGTRIHPNIRVSQYQRKGSLK